MTVDEQSEIIVNGSSKTSPGLIQRLVFRKNGNATISSSTTNDNPVKITNAVIQSSTQNGAATTAAATKIEQVSKSQSQLQLQLESQPSELKENNNSGNKIFDYLADLFTFRSKNTSKTVTK